MVEGPALQVSHDVSGAPRALVPIGIAFHVRHLPFARAARQVAKVEREGR
jgi:hypothetical protein